MKKHVAVPPLTWLTTTVVIVMYWRKVLEGICSVEVQKPTCHVPGLLVFPFFLPEKASQFAHIKLKSLKSRGVRDAVKSQPAEHLK